MAGNEKPRDVYRKSDGQWQYADTKDVIATGGINGAIAALLLYFLCYSPLACCVDQRLLFEADRVLGYTKYRRNL